MTGGLAFISSLEPCHWYGLAAAAAVALSRLSERAHPSRFLALMLLGFWGLSNTVPPVTEPWLDVVGFYAVFRALEPALLPVPRPYASAEPERIEAWLLALAGLFAAQIATHLFGAWLGPYTRQVVLNALFALQLLAVAAPGGTNAARLFRRWRVDSYSPGGLPAGASSVARQEAEG